MEASQTIANYQALTIRRDAAVGMSVMDEAGGAIIYQSADVFAVTSGALTASADLAETASPVRVILDTGMVVDVTLEDVVAEAAEDDPSAAEEQG
ncbi:hypothetical protein [Novosphingobium sp. 9]|uniref:hypothetical protein n=1 Tax=Novosphingobium sp. 9 TaxID=2025349 RepID=UPI0021B5F9F3|nr:hypothetical protein [Novosphingobium sp. 9]